MARTVLVADDSPTHQRRATGILTGEGLEVVTVSNGVAAIKKLAAVKPSLILADVSMPGRDGYEVCEYVKSSPDLAHVPVLLIFSDQEPFDEGRAQRVRADGRIKKPFEQDDLVATVTRYLLPEKAAPPPPPPSPPAEPSIVTEPVDLEADLSTSTSSPEFSALPEGMSFGGTSLDEIAPPAEPPAPFPEPPALTLEPAMGLESPLEAAIPPEPEARTEEPPEKFPAALEEAALPPPPPVETPAEEPVLIEESEPDAEPEPEPERAGERTMMFRMPVQLAQPILADDLAPAPALEEPTPPPETEEEPAPPVSATTLESYSLTDATSGHVRFADPETVIPTTEKMRPAEEPTQESPAETAAAPYQALDVELINWIVQSVVIRMAPPALRTETLDEIVKQLSDEIITALNQPPPEA